MGSQAGSTTWGSRGRSLLRTGGTVLGTLVVIAVALGLVVSCDSPENPRVRASRTPLPTPRSIVRHGVSYRVAPRPPSGVIAERGSRTVTVYAMDIEHRTEPACSSLNPQVRLVSETATTVRIATFVYVLPARGEGKRMCLYNVGGSPSLYAARRVRLRQPLGRRRLVDDDSGEQRVSSKITWSSNGRLRGHARVGGAVARVSDATDERCVSWSPRGGLVTEVCSVSEGRLLAVDELLRVARVVV